jgi:hypothetical protein
MLEAPVPDPLRDIAQAPALGQPLSNRVEVWIDLEMPPLLAKPSLTAAQRVAYRHEIDAAQTLLMERLQRWEAEERARVQIVRNAIVVEVPESALDEIRKLPGVARVSRVTHRNRIDGPVTESNSLPESRSLP